MKLSNLAQRLEELAAVSESLGAFDPTTRRITAAPAANSSMLAPRRRTLGTRSIQIRDQGLRPFRVV